MKDIYLFSQAEKELSNFFIQSSLKFSIISLTAQYFLSLIAYNIYDNQKDWIFFGSESILEELLEENYNNSKRFNIHSSSSYTLALLPVIRYRSKSLRLLG